MFPPAAGEARVLVPEPPHLSPQIREVQVLVVAPVVEGREYPGRAGDGYMERAALASVAIRYHLGEDVDAVRIVLQSGGGLVGLRVGARMERDGGADLVAAGGEEPDCPNGADELVGELSLLRGAPWHCSAWPRGK